MIFAATRGSSQRESRRAPSRVAAHGNAATALARITRTHAFGDSTRARFEARHTGGLNGTIRVAMGHSINEAYEKLEKIGQGT